MRMEALTIEARPVLDGLGFVVVFDLWVDGKAEFEAEHANTPPEDRPDWPLPSFDARDWAKAFCRRYMIQKRAGYDTVPVDDDIDVMVGWFANALMRGFDQPR